MSIYFGENASGACRAIEELTLALEEIGGVLGVETSDYADDSA